MSLKESDLTVKELFQTDNKELYNDDKDLLEFFETVCYPWELLGSSIKKFMERTIEKYRKLGVQEAKAPQNVVVNGNVFIEEGATIEPFAYIEGPTIIRKGATVRHTAYIRGGVYVANDAVVGHTTEVKNSILLKSAKAAHFNYLGDSILGMNVNLGAGTKLANLRFDRKPIVISKDGIKIETNIKKIGAIMANNSQTGCNSVLNPGTILLKGAMVAPNATATGVIVTICR